jgi:hypothetical protein
MAPETFVPPEKKSPWFGISIVLLIVVMGFLFFVGASRMSRHEYLNRSPQQDTSPAPNPPAVNP